MTLLALCLAAALLLALDRRHRPRHRIDSFPVPPPVPASGDFPPADFDD